MCCSIYCIVCIYIWGVIYIINYELTISPFYVYTYVFLTHTHTHTQSNITITITVGIVAYMLLCGAPPFYGDSSEQIHEMIRTREASYPAKRLGHVTDISIDFLKRLLTKDPNKRISMEDALNHPFIHSANNHIIGKYIGYI